MTNFGPYNSGAQLAANHGQMTNHFHMAPQQSAPQPNPFSTVPFSADPGYIKRPIASTLRKWFDARGDWIALVGIGGVGKSKIAIEFAAEIRKDCPDTWVFWIHASTLARFDEDVAEIVRRLKIPELEREGAVMIELLQDWLSEDESRRWLLIVDNLDDRSVSSEPVSIPGRQSAKPREAFIPRCNHGSVILTSRYREAVSGLGKDKHIHFVEAMGEDDAVALLQERLNTPCDREAVAGLAQSLSCMPLAMTQAAAYINHLHPGCTVRDYCDQLNKDLGAQTALLDHEEGDTDRDRDAKNSITRTWYISYEHIRKTRPSAAELLALMSFFDRQSIPRSLLRYETGAEGARHLAAAHETENGLTLLVDYSFVSRTLDPQVFEMHRLVQTAMQHWLRAEDRLLKLCTSQFINILNDAFPENSGSRESWPSCQALFPHAKAAMSVRPEGRDAKLAMVDLMRNCAMYANYQSQNRDSACMLELAIRSSNGTLAQDDDLVLDLMDGLSVAKEQLGSFNEAFDIVEQLYWLTVKKFGPDDRRTLKHKIELAFINCERSQLTEALASLSELLERCRALFGASDRLALRCEYVLALCYNRAGQFQESVNTLKSGNSHAEVLGSLHEETLNADGLLADSYGLINSPESLEKAAKLRKQLVGAYTQSKGADHPETLSEQTELADLYRLQGRHDKGEALATKTLSALQQTCGSQHIYTLRAMFVLARFYLERGPLQQAETLFSEVLNTRDKVFGKKDKQTLSAAAQLGFTYYMQDRFDEAESLEDRVLKGRQELLGQEHPETLMAMGNQALTRRALGNKQSAIELLTSCVELSEAVFGPDHPETIERREELESWKNEDPPPSEPTKSSLEHSPPSPEPIDTFSGTFTALSHDQAEGGASSSHPKDPAPASAPRPQHGSKAPQSGGLTTNSVLGPNKRRRLA